MHSGPASAPVRPPRKAERSIGQPQTAGLLHESGSSSGISQPALKMVAPSPTATAPPRTSQTPTMPAACHPATSSPSRVSIVSRNRSGVSETAEW
jgi:hypothetical protein